ncbi:MAG: hypothetical protein WC496_02625 [Phycisphaerae bacterium]|jgi:hypothetical protein
MEKGSIEKIETIPDLIDIDSIAQMLNTACEAVGGYTQNSPPH